MADSHWDTFLSVFRWILIGGAITYGLYVVLWLLSFPVFAITGRRYSVRPTRPLRRILASYVALGPVMLFNLVLIFVLFLGQYFFIHDVFEAASDPGRRFRSAAESVLQDRGPEAVRRVTESVVADPKKAWTTARTNFETFTGSEYYEWSKWMGERIWDVHRGLDHIVLLVLVFVMLKDLVWTSWGLARYPLEAGRKSIREIAARVVQIVLFTIGSALFFAACGAGLWLLTWVLFQSATGLAQTYFTEILVASVQNPVAPIEPFLLLFGFHLFLLEAAVLLGVTTTIFVVGSRRALRLYSGRAAAKVMKVAAPEKDPPELLVLVYWTGSILFKVATAAAIVWVPMEWIVFPALGFSAGCAIAFAFHAVLFNVVLILFRIDRDFAVVFGELGKGLQLPRGAQAGLLLIPALEAADFHS